MAIDARKLKNFLRLYDNYKAKLYSASDLSPRGYTSPSPYPIQPGPLCVHTVDVLYQSPTMLVLKSRYIDIIWKAVDLAQKEGYKIGGISTYITTSTGLERTDYVNALC